MLRCGLVQSVCYSLLLLINDRLSLNGAKQDIMFERCALGQDGGESVCGEEVSE